MTIYNCKVKGLLGSAYPWSMRFRCESTVAESAISAELASAFTTFWTTATDGYENYCTSVVTVTAAEAATLNPNLRLLSKTTTTLALAGTYSATPSLPYVMSLRANLFNATDTKSNRGFFHLPPPATGFVSSGLWSSALETSFDTVFQTFWDNMHTLAAFQVTSYNRLTNKQGEVPFTRHALTNWKLALKPATNRQRVRKQIPTYSAGGPLT